MIRSCLRFRLFAALSLLAMSLTIACGGESSSLLLNHPALEQYDNEHTTDGQRHLAGNEVANYIAFPPYGQEHSPIPQPCGVYSGTPTFEMVVHGMEHGAIILWYQPAAIDQRQFSILTEISANHIDDGEYVIQAPYEGLSSPLMLVAWGVRLPLEAVDSQLIEAFFDEFHDQAPEPVGAGGCASAH